MHELILIEILAVPAERSRGRHNPRVVKRKMSNYGLRPRASQATIWLGFAAAIRILK